MGDLRAEVIVASTRAAAGERADRTGPVLRAFLEELGFVVPDPVVVADGVAVGEAIRAAVDRGAAVVLTTGGTGLSPTDLTPELTHPLLDREIPGIPEALRAYGTSRGVPGAALSRGLAGLSGTTLVINLPGSTGAVSDAIEVLRRLLPHAVDQASSPHPDH